MRGRESDSETRYRPQAPTSRTQIAWIGILLFLGGSGCVARTGYSHRSASGGVLYAGFDGADETKAIGAQVGLGLHHEQEGNPLSLRGDVHVGVPSRAVSSMNAGDVLWAPLAYAGIDRTTGDSYGDFTVPLGVGLSVVTVLGDSSALIVTPRYNYHLGDESDPGRSHEFLLTLGLGWIPDIELPGMKN